MKVLVINPNYLDATSYYRAWGTFKDLTDRHGIEFTLYESIMVLQPPKNGQRALGVAWPDLIKFDAVMFQRALGVESLQLLNYCKDLGLKIWYDLDDDLWNIPEGYWIKSQFPPKIMETIEEHIKQSDLVTVSTQTLAEVIKEKTGVDSHVIPNAWDIDRFPFQDHNPNGAIMWRGSNTHKDDLRACLKDLETIGQSNHIQFWGYNPVKDRPLLNIQNYSFVEPLDPILYFRRLLIKSPKAFLVPLKDSQFNRSKSNIAWIEATAAGAVTFSNKVGEFDKVTLGFDSLNEVLGNESNVAMNLEISRDMVNELYNLKTVNNKRAELIKGLCKG